MSTTRISFSLFDPVLVRPAIVESFAKLDPRGQWRNPVMFVVYVGSILTTVLGVQALTGKGGRLPDSSSPSPFGSGSPCSSPTSPKRSPKDAARRRPPACAE